MVSQIYELEIEPLKKSEKLGRDERSQTDAKRSYRQLMRNESRVPVSKFVPPKNTNDISVNRLDLASPSILAEIGTKNARLTCKHKQFWGWYVLSVENVRAARCFVKPTPMSDNQYHADIVVPVVLNAEERKHDLREYAMDLAKYAKFVPWGEWTKEVS